MRIRNAVYLVLMAFILSAPIAAQASGGKATPLATRKILAKISLTSNEIVYVDEVKATINDIERIAKGQKLSSKDKLNVVLQKIDDVLFKQFGERESIKISDAEVNAKLAEMKGQAATDEMLQTTLFAQGILIDYKNYIRDELIFTRYIMTKKQDELKAAGKYEVQEFLKAYDDMKYNLRRPDLLRFAMIFVNIQGKSDADKKKAADLMDSISKQIKVNPSRFDEFLIKGLIDPSAGYTTAPSGIIYKTQDSKKQNPAIYEAAFALKEGQISDVIADDVRICIMRATEFLPEKQLGLTDRIDTLPSSGTAGYVQSLSPNATVLDLIAFDLRNSKSEAFSKKIKNEIFSDIRKKASIKITTASLSDLLDDAEIEALKSKKSDYNFTFE